MRGTVTATVATTVKFGECADADGFSEVDVTCDGGWIFVEFLVARGVIEVSKTWKKCDMLVWIHTCTRVIPVGVIGSKLLVVTSLDNVNPCGNLKLA